MNEVISTILSRRSVRSFENCQISDEELKNILECALYAPSGGNSQCCRLIVLQSADNIEELNSICVNELASMEIREGQVMNIGINAARKDGCHFFYHAPTVIAAAAPADYSNSMASCAVALENAMIGAMSMGIGSCWNNQPHWLTDKASIRRFFEPFGLRGDEDIFGTVSFGYPTHVSSRHRPRKEGRVAFDTEKDMTFN